MLVNPLDPPCFVQIEGITFWVRVGFVAATSLVPLVTGTYCVLDHAWL
ncbi:MAG: hypothetical protein ACRDTT_08420 [Pseudonocardiaceae bacterium]